MRPQLWLVRLQERLCWLVVGATRRLPELRVRLRELLVGL